MQFFDMDDDVYIKGRWHLVRPTDKNGADLSGLFSRGERTRVAGPVRLTHSDAAERGSPLDYSVISGTTVPLVRAGVAKLLERLAPNDVEYVPAIVEGFSEQFYIANVLTTRRCIDEGASAYTEKFTEADADLFPEKVGQYTIVNKLRIDKSKVGGAKVFRTWGWVAIIVSEDIKDAFEAAHVKGAKFVEV